MIKKMLLFTLLSCPFIVSAQKNKMPDFDVAELNAKDDLALWLCRYDAVAWVTSDSVSASPKEQMQQLGKQWFCFKEKKQWHAVYGKYKDGSFNMVFHYVSDSAGKIKRIYSPIDSSMSGAFSRALINSDQMMRKYLDTNYKLQFNQYIRLDSDKSISVWLFPAFQGDGSAVYGAEFYYKYDDHGNKLLEKNEYFQGKFRGFKTGNKREIYLNYTDLNQPTLGAVFFVRYYRQYFTNIVIETKKATTELFYSPDNGYSWITALKEENKDK
jgi:hypothetical protein